MRVQLKVEPNREPLAIRWKWVIVGENAESRTFGLLALGHVCET